MKNFKMGKVNINYRNDISLPLLKNTLKRAIKQVKKRGKLTIYPQITQIFPSWWEDKIKKGENNGNKKC